MSDGWNGRLRTAGGEFVCFLRYVPLVLSLLVAVGLMLRQLGEYFGVHNLVDYAEWTHQLAAGFALTLVALHCLCIGYLFVRARRQDVSLPFVPFVLIVALCYVPLIAVAYGLHSPLAGFQELILDSGFCSGIGLAVLLLIASWNVGRMLGQIVLRSGNSTIVERCQTLRNELDDAWDFRIGTAILVGYTILMALLVTYIGAISNPWIMYLAGILLAASFIYFGLRGPLWLRNKILRAIGAENLLNRPEGVESVMAWLSFLIIGEVILCVLSLGTGLGGSPITTVCTLWIGGLASYVFFRNITVRAPALVLIFAVILVMQGGRDEYKYRFEGDLYYDNLADMQAEATRDHNRQAAHDLKSAELAKLKEQFAESQDRAKDSQKITELSAELDNLRLALLKENRVIAPRANWQDDESEIAAHAHGLLDLRHIQFRPYDAIPARSRLSRPLVLVAVSGGGLRSAAWTYRVLEMLDKELAKEGVDFASHVRLICGASGGMLGASYFVGNLEAMDVRKERLNNRNAAEKPYAGDPFNRLTADYLTPVMNTFVFHDIPFMFSPWRPKTDRGITLQNEWMKIEGLRGHFPLGTTFAELRDRERRGEIPSLAFTPMIVEDGRRLIISNMDFRWVTTNGGHRIGGPTTFSAEAIELFRLMPKEASHIRLATAARMSASFPYVSSPAVLPTKPRRRVVDAGYYDNYGVSLAASWLFSGSHQRTLSDRKIQRVLLIQIRDGISDPHRKLDVVGARETNQLMRAAEEFTTPLTGFYNGQNSSSSFRNDGLLEVLSHLYKAKRKPPRYTNKNLQVKALSENFMTMTLEYSGNASLSWYLTDDERESIRNSSELVTDRELRDLESLNRDEAEILLGDENQQRKRRADLDEICRERLTHRMRQLVKWWLESNETTIRPPPFTVVPEAEVDDELDRKYLNAGYRRFSMRLKVPPKHSEEIKSVTYLMNHPSFYHKELPATQGYKDDFKVSYIGYGALNQVVIRIVMNNGKIYETDFDQQATTYR